MQKFFLAKYLSLPKLNLNPFFFVFVFAERRNSDTLNLFNPSSLVLFATFSIRLAIILVNLIDSILCDIDPDYLSSKLLNKTK